MFTNAMEKPEIKTSSSSKEIGLFKDLLWVRLCEETLVKLYHEQEMRTPIHYGTGQEAIAVGVCNALRKGDVAFSHHRSHNHFLAKGGSFFELAAELYGRIGGCCEGRGGSVHLTDRDKGFIMSSAILGETIAVATGSAHAFKMDGLPYVSVPFFGDGSCEEGSFYESINFASLFKLPVLYVCENNMLSTESPLSIRKAENSTLHARAQSLGAESEVIDGNDVFAVYHATLKALERIRTGNGPFFLECITYRWREHVGPNFDYEIPARTFRTKEEQEYWINEKCPIKNAQAQLIKEGKITHEEVSDWVTSMEYSIQDAITKAKHSAWPEPSTLLNHVL